jgi:phage baseplate assembly protein W|tara:strand:+ start:613 stop:1014 length:402 start_codon:yes stop_codon:yes gene_type:complete
MSVSISRSFRDISLSFTRHPVTNDVTTLRNEDAIKKSVVNLVRTRTNERFFNELLGTSVGDTLFELNNDYQSDGLKEEIVTLLENFEPRIRLTDVYVDPELDSNNLLIRIEYDIVGLPLPIQNIEFILQPSRV